MLSEPTLSKPFYPQLGCDSGKFSPLKRDDFFEEVSAETGRFHIFKHRRNPAPSKGLQRSSRARVKKLKTQEVKYIQVVGAPSLWKTRKPQTTRASPSERGGRRYLTRAGANLSGLVNLSALATSSSGGVLAAEEGLVEVVDAGVESADLSAHFLSERSDIGAYFLAEASHVSTHFLAKRGHVLADGGDCSPQAEANPQDRDDDGDGAHVHGQRITERSLK